MGELSGRAKQGEGCKKFATRTQAELFDENKQVFYLFYLQKLSFSSLKNLGR